MEVIAPDGNYNFHNKYEGDKTKYICPPKLPLDVIRSIEESSVKAFKTLGCRHWARVDFIWDENGEPEILELNTVPGMTEKSLVPMAASKTGLTFDDLVLKILKARRSKQGLTMHIKYLKELILHAWNSPKALNLFSLIIGSLTFLYLLFLCYSWIISHKHFTLKNVVLEVVNNDNSNIDTQEIQQVIKTTLNGTTLSTDLKMMVELILDNPWVEQVVVRRVWPDTMVLRLQERRIIALWNNKYLISELGEVTNIPVSDYKKVEKKLGCYLIRIEGPKDF